MANNFEFAFDTATNSSGDPTNFNNAVPPNEAQYDLPNPFPFDSSAGVAPGSYQYGPSAYGPGWGNHIPISNNFGAFAESNNLAPTPDAGALLEAFLPQNQGEAPNFSAENVQLDPKFNDLAAGQYQPGTDYTTLAPPVDGAAYYTPADNPHSGAGLFMTPAGQILPGANYSVPPVPQEGTACNNSASPNQEPSPFDYSAGNPIQLGTELAAPAAAPAPAPTQEGNNSNVASAPTCDLIQTMTNFFSADTARYAQGQQPEQDPHRQPRHVIKPSGFSPEDLQSLCHSHAKVLALKDQAEARNRDLEAQLAAAQQEVARLTAPAPAPVPRRRQGNGGQARRRGKGKAVAGVNGPVQSPGPQEGASSSAPQPPPLQDDPAQPSAPQEGASSSAPLPPPPQQDDPGQTLAPQPSPPRLQLPTGARQIVNGPKTSLVPTRKLQWQVDEEKRQRAEAEAQRKEAVRQALQTRAGEKRKALGNGQNQGNKRQRKASALEAGEQGKESDKAQGSDAGRDEPLDAESVHEQEVRRMMDRQLQAEEEASREMREPSTISEVVVGDPDAPVDDEMMLGYLDPEVLEGINAENS